MPVSSVTIGCCTNYTVAGKCTVDGNNNKEDKTREEADMTPSRIFPKIFKSGPKLSKSVLEWSKSIFQVFLTVTHILDQFWTALDTFEEKKTG